MKGSKLSAQNYAGANEDRSHSGSTTSESDSDIDSDTDSDVDSDADSDSIGPLPSGANEDISHSESTTNEFDSDSVGDTDSDTDDTDDTDGNTDSDADNDSGSNASNDADSDTDSDTDESPLRYFIAYLLGSFLLGFTELVELICPSGNTGQLLALEELQAGTTTGGDVAELVLNAVLLGNGSGVTTTDDDDLAVLLDSVDNSIESLLGALGELLELEDTGRTVPEDGLGLSDGLLVELDGLVAAVKSLPAVGDTVLVGGVASVGVLVELVGSDVVDGENELNALGLGLLNEAANSLGTGLVEERVTDGDVLEGLLEGEGHATADDEGVDLVKEVVDELDLVGDLGTTEDGKEGALRLLEGLGEVLKLLLDEETGSLLGEVDTDHGGVSTVSIGLLTDVNVAKSGQALAESLNLSLVGLGLVALLILGGALLLNVESEVLEEDDRAILSLVDDLLDLGADAVRGEGDLLAQELLKLGDNGLEGVLLVGRAVGTAEMRHEDD
ncbi:hypothetical protein HG530_001185 [Fusarium avenaceum]|nr:hypothetical protein HG530_001185 [Fusarium avenaceum]